MWDLFEILWDYLVSIHPIYICSLLFLSGLVASIIKDCLHWRENREREDRERRREGYRHLNHRPPQTSDDN